MNKIIMAKNLFILFIIFSYTLSAQKAETTYSLEDCISIAQLKSPSAKIAKGRYRQRQKIYDAFFYGLYPQLSFSGALPGLSKSIVSIPSGGNDMLFSQSQMTSRGDLNISQKIPFTGGDLFISSGLTRYDYIDADPELKWLSVPLSITLSQPVFALNTTAWDKEEQELSYASSDKKYIEDMEDIALTTTNLFFEVYLQQVVVGNARKNVAVNDTLYQLSKGRYNVGKIAENDLLQSELALSNKKIELENALLDYDRAMENLINTMGLKGTNNINIQAPFEIPVISFDVNDAINEAFQNRSDILDFKIDELRADRAVESAESRNSFNATISASFGLNRSVNDLKTAYQELLDQERFNINFSVPVFTWGKGASEVEAALADRERVKGTIEQRRNNFELNVKYQALKFIQLQKQVPVSAKADTIATRRFEVAKNRYLIGKIDLNTFFIAQNEKDRALIQYINTLHDFWRAYYNLRRLTLYDFENDIPLMK